MFKHHHVYQAWNTLPTNTVTGIEEQTEAVVEANDTLLERVDKIMDMLKQDKHSNKLEVQQKSSKNVSKLTPGHVFVICNFISAEN